MHTHKSKFYVSDWHVLIASDQLHSENDKAFRIHQIIELLKERHDIHTIPSSSFDDTLEIIKNRQDLSCVVIDWDTKSPSFESARELVFDTRRRNKKLPIVLLTDKTEMNDIPLDIMEKITGYLWVVSDTVDFLAGRIKMRSDEYVDTVYPKFFKGLVDYVAEYKYAWHTPGHMGGQGFLRAPAGVALFKFFGENTLRSDLSISVPELGSLLDHSGVVGDAEKNSAEVFGADQTYYVLNGTSNCNQIIWRSQVTRDDIAFVDRNCHKSLNYSMVITDAYPIYMIPRRNHLGIIGPVRLNEFTQEYIEELIDKNKIIPEDKKSGKVQMSALTNSTYDGVCYNAVKIAKKLKKHINNIHFDEAWYAYARFHPIYKNFYGMADETTHSEHPPIFVSQSTHKLLTAFSQSSMLHIKDGSHRKIEPDQFNESYMMHSSTSPQYNMIASLDVATKMMQDSGEVTLDDTIVSAIMLRKKILSLKKEIKYRDQRDWFFDLWQPKQVVVNGKETNFEEVDNSFLSSNQSVWIMSKDDPWHGFDDIEDDYVMLDPIKLTFVMPGINEKGEYQDHGIPASVVTDFLIREGIVCEKSDYYSFLLLNSMGTTRGKQGVLVTQLLKFKELYDNNAKMSEVLPEMVESYPEHYENKGIKDYCDEIHNFIKKHKMLDLMQKAYEVIPDQVMKPSEAYNEVVRGRVEYVELEHIKDRVPAVMVVPYPPGIPIMMGGEILNERANAIYEYLKLREEFENLFPGNESDIHGVTRVEKDGKKLFQIYCIKK